MLKGLHTRTVWPAACSAVASGRWYDPVASMPTRTRVPNVANQLRQAVMPTDVVAKRRTCSAGATSNQRAETSTPNVWMLMRDLQRGRKLAEERTDPLVTPVHAGSVASDTVRPGWSRRCGALSAQRRPDANGKSRLSAPPVPERSALLLKIPTAKPRPFRQHARRRGAGRSAPGVTGSDR